MLQTDALADACRAWQSDRDGGSTPIRAAARRLTRVPHYFSADWLRDVEDRAEADDQTMRRARMLMQALVASEPTDAEGWCQRLEVPGAFVGRGLGAKEEDDQILRSLRSGLIFMPLWGASLSEEIARSYGEQWLFVIEGPFHGIAAWQHSQIKDAERELIAGGCYEVLGASRIASPPTVVRLREVGALWPPPKHPPSTWTVERPFDLAEYLDRPPPRYEPQ
jgi:hypothetical protein